MKNKTIEIQTEPGMEINSIARSVLPEGTSLIIYNKKREIVFKSDGKWLYPLLELDEYLDTNSLSADGLFLHDKIAGKAAAALIIRMGITACHINILSSPALTMFEEHEVTCTYDSLVEKIDCRTESIIDSSMDIETIYIMLRKRAGRIHGVGLEIENLAASFGKKRILRNINLKLDAGDKLVITGDNGVGKSTLLKSIIGVVKTDTGTIEINGMNSSVHSRNPSPVGYVNQNVPASSMPITAEEVVSCGLLKQKMAISERRYQVELAMRRTGCYHLASRNVHTLSGGERQRVSLARCLAQKAGLILLDEPTSFLDRNAKDELLKLLNQLSRKVMPTMLIVSHDQEWISRLGWPAKELKDGIL